MRSWRSPDWVLGIIAAAVTSQAGAADLCDQSTGQFRKETAAQLSAAFQTKLTMGEDTSSFVEAESCDKIRAFEAACVKADSKACFARLDSYLAYNCRAPDHHMGFALTDQEYYHETQKRLGDEATRVPTELTVAYLSSSDVGDQLKAEVARHARAGWKGLEYYSTSVANPPNDSHRRYLVLVPGVKADRWIQFTLPDPGGEGAKVEREIAFQTVEKDSGGGAINTYFREFWRTGDSPPFVLLEKAFSEGHGVGDKCTGCHASGLRHIDLSKDEGEWDLKEGERFNKIIDEYGKLGLGPKSWYDPAANGPPVGKAASFDKSCLKNTPGARPDRVKQAISCSSCHNEGSLRGKLTAGVSPSTVHFKIKSTASAPMPPQSVRARLGLTEAEIDAIVPCLAQAYVADLKQWLEGDPRCQSAVQALPAGPGPAELAP